MGPLADDLGVPDRARGAPQDAELPISDLVAVAVRAVQNVAGPPFAQTGQVRQLIAKPGGDQQPPCRDSPSTLEEDPEPGHAVGHQVGRGAVEEVTSVVLYFVPTGRQK